MLAAASSGPLPRTRRLGDILHGFFCWRRSYMAPKKAQTSSPPTLPPTVLSPRAPFVRFCGVLCVAELRLWEKQSAADKAP